MKSYIELFLILLLVINLILSILSFTSQNKQKEKDRSLRENYDPDNPNPVCFDAQNICDSLAYNFDPNDTNLNAFCSGLSLQCQGISLYDNGGDIDKCLNNNCNNLSDANSMWDCQKKCAGWGSNWPWP